MPPWSNKTKSKSTSTLTRSGSTRSSQGAGQLPCKTITVVVLGEPSVGKSQLMLSYAQKPFNTEPTFDSYIRQFEMKDSRDRPYIVNLRLIEPRVNLDVVEGEESGFNLDVVQQSPVDAILLCASCIDPVSLSRLSGRWYTELKAKGLINLPIILVITKNDLEKREGQSPAPYDWDLVDFPMISKAAQLLRVKDLYHCSAKTGYNVESVCLRAACLAIRYQAQHKTAKGASSGGGSAAGQKERKRSFLCINF